MRGFHKKNEQNLSLARHAPAIARDGAYFRDVQRRRALHNSANLCAARLRQIAAGQGYDGPYVRLMQRVGGSVEKAHEKLPLLINAVDAIISEPDLTWKTVSGTVF